MRHAIHRNNLGRTNSHRLAMMRNLSRALIDNERIVTTLVKAKELRGFVEPLITLSKNNNLPTRRLILSRLANAKLTTKKLLDNLGPRFKDRKGGYTRIIRLSLRRGDSTRMAIIELVDRNPDIDKNRKIKREKRKAASSQEAAQKQGAGAKT